MHAPQLAHSVPLREAHGHLPWLGKALDMLSLHEAVDITDALDRLSARLRTPRPAGSPAFLQAHSARPEAWAEGRWFTRRELDRATGDVPVVVMSFDHHSVVANSAALALASIDRTTPDPPGGIIERIASGPHAGEPSGLLLESAAQRVWSLAPEPDESLRTEQIARALAHLASLGFVEMHDLLSPVWLGPTLAQLDRAGRLPLRVGLFAPVDEIERHAADRRSWENPRLRLLGGKIFTDGTLNSRTAWVLEPYAHAPPDLLHGKALMTPDQIKAAAERCLRLSLGLAMHAIGDGAVRACLDGVAQISGSLRPRGSASLPIRIEHCELIDAADIPRFAELGVIASVQPCHLLADIEALRRALPHRLHRVMPWRDLIRSGLKPGRTLLFGSDVPVVRADPADSLQAAVHRRRPGMSADEAIAPEQALDDATALRCFQILEEA